VNQTPVDLEHGDALHARRRLEGVVHETPLLSARGLGAAIDVDLWLKPECLQKTGSWKIRGAYTVLSRLGEADRARGVVTFSSGNWGQAVSCAAAMLDVRAVVVLPEGANPKKVSATRGYGAEVVIHGRNSEQLLEKAWSVHQADGSVFINPLDNRDMIAGAASLGLEIVDQLPEVDAIVVPLGGGALIAGAAFGAKSEKRGVQVYGVQPRGACAVYESLRRGGVVELERVETIADGLAVKRPSASTVELIARWVDDVVLVSDDEIRRAMYSLLERAKLLVEPSGAASLAALMSGRTPDLRGRRVVAVLTGGNADFGLLGEVLQA